jgi:hypothetical protein
MEYETIDTLPQEDAHLAHVKTPIRSADGVIFANKFTEGIRCGDTYPATARIGMDPDWPAIQLGGVLANTSRILVVHEALKSLIQAAMKPQDEIEFLPLAILNHKGRVASQAYFIVNPIGTLDCMDKKRSKFIFTGDGRLYRVEKYVLDSKKIPWEPAIFRPKESPSVYIINGKITTAFKDSGFVDRNVMVDELEIV